MQFSPLLIIQVEVKIDNSREKTKDDILTNYTIEAALFDTGGLDGTDNMISTDVAHLELFKYTGPVLGFHGYLLVGKLQMPKLWSAEQVRNLSQIQKFIFCLLIQQLSSYFKD